MGRVRLCVWLVAALTAWMSRAARGDEFTYQGCLKEHDIVAEGCVDLRITLWDSESMGAQLGDPIVICNVCVDQNGCFSVVLNESGEFGEEILTNEGRYLQIELDPSGTCTDFIALIPRSRIRSFPWAKVSSGTRGDADHRGTVVDVRLVTEDGVPGIFSISNGLSTNNALSASTSGSGDGLSAESGGSGNAVSGTATGTGRAGIFQIPLPGNGNDAVLITTAGSGRGLRAFSASGVGIFAESATGTALHVAGVSAFSGTAAFNHVMPFTVASAAQVPNLNASLLGGGDSNFYRDASNLNAGTLPSARFSGSYSNVVTFANALNSFAGDGAALTSLNASSLSTGTLPNARLAGTYGSAVTLSNASNVLAGSGAALTSLNASALSSGTLVDARLSSNVALLDTVQTFSAARMFTGPTTFSALATFNTRAIMTANTAMPALLVTNNGAGRAGDFRGPVHVVGDVTREYGIDDASRATPIAYGSISAAAESLAGTPNFSAEFSNNRFFITITGEAYMATSYITIVTPVLEGAETAVLATTGADAGRLVVRLHPLGGGALQARAFHFVTYKQ